MKKLARMIVVGLLVVPFAVLGGCCSKCKHHHHVDHGHKMEKMKYECGGK